MALCLHEYVGAGKGAADSGGKAEAPRNPKESADVVRAKIDVSNEDDGKRKVVVALTIADGWHIYANPVGNDKLVESQTEMTVFVDGTAVKTDVTYQKGKEYTDAAGEKYNVYVEGAAMTAITSTLRASKIEARLKLTACKDGKCLLPSVIKIGPSAAPGPTP